MGDSNNVWESPDGIIRKEIIVSGVWGTKPWHCSECSINISNINSSNIDIEKYNRKIVIGESDSKFKNLLDNCLMTMNKHEEANVTFKLQENITFRLKLLEFEFKGYIYEWDAKYKFEQATKLKEIGKELFKTQHIDASRNFSQALKIICSVPIDVEGPPAEIDGIKLDEIKKLKAVLYNNLASCYLKSNKIDTVIDLCKKVLYIEENNVKALYRISVAYIDDRDWENAYTHLKKLLELEPNNGAAMEKLKFVNCKLEEAKVQVNNMMKKMFAGI